MHTHGHTHMHMCKHMHLCACPSACMSPHLGPQASLEAPNGVSFWHLKSIIGQKMGLLTEIFGVPPQSSGKIPISWPNPSQQQFWEEGDKGGVGRSLVPSSSPKHLPFKPRRSGLRPLLAYIIYKIGFNIDMISTFVPQVSSYRYLIIFYRWCRRRGPPKHPTKRSLVRVFADLQSPDSSDPRPEPPMPPWAGYPRGIGGSGLGSRLVFFLLVQKMHWDPAPSASLGSTDLSTFSVQARKIMQRPQDSRVNGLSFAQC